MLAHYNTANSTYSFGTTEKMLQVSCLFTIKIASVILFEMHSSVSSVIVSSLATRLASLKENGGCTVSRHRKLQQNSNSVIAWHQILTRSDSLT